MKNFRLLFTLILICATFIFSNLSNAQGRYSYYLTYFYDLGYFTKMPYLKSYSVSESEDQSKTIILDRYSLVFASQGLQDVSQSHYNLIFICDVDFSLNGVFSCNNDSVESNISTTQFLATDTILGKDLLIHEVKYQYKNMIIIPEVYFVNDSYRSKLSSYFRERYELDLIRLGLEDLRLHESPSSKYVLELLNNMLDRYAFYLSIVLLMISVSVLATSTFSKNLLHKLRTLNIDLSVAALKGYTLYFLEYLQRYSKVFLILFGVSYAYLLMMYLLEYPDASFADVFFYSLFRLEVFILPVAVLSDYSRLLLSVIAVIMLTLYLGSNLNAFFTLSKQNLEQLGKYIHSYGFFLIIMLGSLGVGVTLISDTSASVYIQSWLLFTDLLILLFCWLYPYKLGEARARNLKFLIPLSISCVFFATSLSFVYKKLPNRYREVPLLIARSDLVLLPRDVLVTKDTSFRSFTHKGEIPVFANDYLVYHPKFKNISNSNIDKFKPGSSFYILAPKDMDTFIRKFLANDLLQKELTMSDKASNLVQLQLPLDLSVEEKRAASVKITYKCNSPITAHNLNLKPYLTDVASGKFLTELPRINVLNFSGCDSSIGRKYQNSEISYVIGLDLSSLNSSSIVFRLNGVTWQKIASIEFYVGDLKAQSHYVRNVENELVLHSSLTDSNEIHSYSFDEIEDFEVDNSSSRSKDLAKVINKMVAAGILNDSFTLQSLASGAILNIDL